MVDFNLYLITDRHQTAGRELPAVVADALAGGVTAVQLREKDLPARQLLELALELRGLTRRHGARLLINDRVDVALAAEADGVHLGVASIPVADARRLLGYDKLIGYSSHGVDEALAAQQAGADFVTFGPVYPTPSKAAYGPPLGVGLLAEAAAVLSVPVFALGGVALRSIPEVIDAGASGIALISAIISSPDPESSSRTILEALRNHVESAC